MLLKPLKKAKDKKVRIYVDGVFDLTHYGHGNVFRQAKNLFENSEVIVGINSDRDTIINKGQNVMTQEERRELVASCKYVDQVLCPVDWYPTKAFIEHHNIDFVAHDGAPYRSHNMEDIYSEAKMSGKFIRTFRTPQISTSKLIQRVIRNRERFILALTKRGYSLDDLSVSRLYYCIIKIKSTIKKLFCCGKKEKSNRISAANIDRGVIYKSDV